MIVAFNDNPYVIVSLNAKDMLLIKNADGEKIAIWKILMQVGLGTIFLDIVHDNPTIKQNVGEHAILVHCQHTWMGTTIYRLM